MRLNISTAAILFGLLTQSAVAQQPEARDEGDRPRRPAAERELRRGDDDRAQEVRNREFAEYARNLVKQHDKNDNMMLEQDERGELRGPVALADVNDDNVITVEEIVARLSNPRSRERDRPNDARDRERSREAGRDADRRPRREGDRERADRRRPDRPRGPIGPMGGPRDRNLGTLFGWFDTDGDNLLSRREFAELSQFVDRRRPGPPGGGPAGPRIGRRGFDGPPGGGGNRIDMRMRQRRLEGPPRGDRPGPRERDDRRVRGDERRRPDRLDNAPNRPRPQDARPNAADAI